MTQAEQVALAALPVVAVIGVLVFFVARCSDAVVPDSDRRTAEGAEELVQGFVPRYRVSDCRHVRRLNAGEDAFSCLISGRCSERLLFAVDRVDVISSDALRARPLARAAPRC